MTEPQEGMIYPHEDGEFIIKQVKNHAVSYSFLATGGWYTMDVDDFMLRHPVHTGYKRL